MTTFDKTTAVMFEKRIQYLPYPIKIKFSKRWSCRRIPEVKCQKRTEPFQEFKRIKTNSGFLPKKSQRNSSIFAGTFLCFTPLSAQTLTHSRKYEYFSTRFLIIILRNSWLSKSWAMLVEENKNLLDFTHKTHTRSVHGCVWNVKSVWVIGVRASGALPEFWCA